MAARVTVIENEEGEDLGSLASCFPDALIIRAWAGERVPDDATGGLIVLGGAPSVHELSTGPWMEDVMRLIRRAHSARRPILGVCLGAQLAAHALGGRAVPGTTPEVGFEPIEWTLAARDDALLGTISRERSSPPFFSLHHDTFVPPPGAVRLASSVRYEEQAFRLGAATWGLQFHVEFTPDALARILPEERRDIEAVGADVDALLAEARKNEKEMARAAESIGHAFARLLSA